MTPSPGAVSLAEQIAWVLGHRDREALLLHRYPKSAKFRLRVAAAHATLDTLREVQAEREGVPTANSDAAPRAGDVSSEGSAYYGRCESCEQPLEDCEVSAEDVDLCRKCAAELAEEEGTGAAGQTSTEPTEGA